MADSTPPGSSKVVLLVIRMFCLAVAVFLAGTISARAEGDTLYGALILATNAEHPAPPPQELRAQAATLHAVFGYNEFRMLGQKRQPTPKDPEDWLVASRQFFPAGEHKERGGRRIRARVGAAEGRPRDHRGQRHFEPRAAPVYPRSVCRPRSDHHFDDGPLTAPEGVRCTDFTSASNPLSFSCAAKPRRDLRRGVKIPSSRSAVEAVLRSFGE